MVTCHTELVDGSIEKPVEPKRSWAKVVEDNVNSGQIESLKDQEINSSNTDIETDPFDVPEDGKGKMIKRKTKKVWLFIGNPELKIFRKRRRKRDCALKRRNWSKQQLEESKLS
ncbi:hypothetical protein V6N13_013085 [Hibiscus sabdariffa]